MTNDPFSINHDSANRIDQGMKLGGGIELPFDAPVFWWLNGSPANKALAQSAPAQYFGGWASNAESIDDVQQERGGIPSGLVPTEIYTRDSKTIPSYTSRVLIVAPIGFRSCWMVGGRGSQVRSTGYAPGGRQHIQVLALMGIKIDKDPGYHSWGPIVLSAKGYQAQYIQTALKDWKKTLERPRKEHAPNVPAWAFWCALGTFGQAPQVMQVGKSSTSPITPIDLYVPKDITREKMITLFVGRDGVDEMAALLEDAEEWLNAWKNSEQSSQNTSDAGYEEYPEPAYNGVVEDEIPF